MANGSERAMLQRASRVTRRRARSFYLASLFLPATVRRDVHLLYAFYRSVDDLVDEPPAGLQRQNVLAVLDGWEAALHGRAAAADEFVAATVTVAARHGIPTRYLCMVLDGARRDLDLHAMRTLQELTEYSILVAGSVGMVMAHVLGASDAESLAAACDLGVAMQMTNVLRDVGEDLRRGRIYLPLDELQRHGYSIAALHRGEVSTAFRNAIKSLTDEARGYYASGVRGIPRLHTSAQFAIYLAATLYGRILDKIEEQEYDVFTRRASLNAREKWALTMPTYLAHRSLSRQQS